MVRVFHVRYEHTSGAVKVVVRSGARQLPVRGAGDAEGVLLVDSC